MRVSFVGALFVLVSRDYEDKLRTAVTRWQQQLLVKMFHSWREYRRSDDDDTANNVLSSAPAASSSARVGKKRGAAHAMQAAAAEGMHPAVM